jgi:hypothetical protein
MFHPFIFENESLCCNSLVRTNPEWAEQCTKNYKWMRLTCYINPKRFFLKSISVTLLQFVFAEAKNLGKFAVIKAKQFLFTPGVKNKVKLKNL